MKLLFACLGLYVLIVASLTEGMIVRSSLAKIKAEVAKTDDLKPFLEDKSTDRKRDVPVGEKTTSDNKQDDTRPTSDKKPTDTDPTSDKKPTDTEPVDTKPASDDKPADPKPVDTKPTSDKKPADTKPIDTKPETDDKPTGTKPADTKPTDTKPDAPPNDQPSGDNICSTADERNLKNPQSGKGFFGWWHCMTYTQCKDKKPEIEHCLGWPLIPLKQYSPSAQSCQWFWNVRCGEADSDKPK